jgi:hypothetical protein
MTPKPSGAYSIHASRRKRDDEDVTAVTRLYQKAGEELDLSSRKVAKFDKLVEELAEELAVRKSQAE